MTPEEKQTVLDEEHLRLLALFHYISGAMHCLFSMLGGLWAVMFMTMFSAFPPVSQPGLSEEAARQFQAMPQIMAGFMGLFAVGTLTFGVLEIVAGRCLSQQRWRVFTIVVAVPRLIFIPWGTALSIFTLIVLERASVEALYRRRAGNTEGAATV